MNSIKLIAAPTGTDWKKIQLKKPAIPFVPSVSCSSYGYTNTYRYNIYKDHITLMEHRIHDHMRLEMYWGPGP